MVTKSKFFLILSWCIYTLISNFVLLSQGTCRIFGDAREKLETRRPVWLFWIRKASCKLIDRRSPSNESRSIEKRISKNLMTAKCAFIEITFAGERGSIAAHRLDGAVFLNELPHRRVFAFTLIISNTWIRSEHWELCEVISSRIGLCHYSSSC